VSAKQRVFWSAFLVFHFTIAISIALLDMSSGMVASGRDAAFWQRIEAVTNTILGKGRTEGDWLRELIATYSDCTGIDAGYSYFAPDVPANAKVIFEITDAAGKITYDLPVVDKPPAGIRIATLLESLRTVRYQPFRKAILKILSESAAREHPEAVTIRALLGVAVQPGVTDYLKGKRTFYRRLDVYEYHSQKTD
jgi:hypothetical protein